MGVGVGAFGPNVVLVVINPSAEIALAGDRYLQALDMVAHSEPGPGNAVLVVAVRWVRGELIVVVALGDRVRLAVGLGVDQVTEVYLFRNRMAGAVVGSQRRIGQGRVAEIEPAIIVEDHDLGFVLHDHDLRHADGRVQVHHVGAVDDQAERLIVLDVRVTEYDQRNRDRHFRLGPRGHDQPVHFAVQGPPNHQILTDDRISVFPVEVGGNVL